MKNTLCLIFFSFFLLTCKKEEPEEQRLPDGMEFRAELNADKWTASSYEAVVTDSSIFLYGRSNNGKLISIHIPSIALGKKVYSFGFMDLGNGTTSSHTGEAVLTYHDADKKIVSGSFHLYQEAFGYIQINGKFENLVYKNSYPPGAPNKISIYGYHFPKIWVKQTAVWFEAANGMDELTGAIIINKRELTSGHFNSYSPRFCKGYFYGGVSVTKHDLLNRTFEGNFKMGRTLNLGSYDTCHWIEGNFEVTYY